MTVGVLGGGQLGRMLALAGYPLGLRFRFLSQGADASAAPLGQLVVGDYTDPAVLRRFADGLDVATYEFENVPVGAVRQLAAHVPVYPPPEALETAQDRLTEKRLFERLAVPVPSWAPVERRVELDQAVRDIGLPGVLKTRRLGYDGKGQFTLLDKSDVARAWDMLSGDALLYEAYVDFVSELSVLAVRGRSGETVFYPLVENHHRGGMLRLSFAPASSVSPEWQRLAEDYACRVLDALNYVGVLAIEFFGTEGGELLANEFAPRVHNSGHWTIEGAVTSQFENHLRAILGLPLGDTSPRGCSAMINLIGTTPDLETVLAIPGAHLHLYDKTPAPGRKLGHVTLGAAAQADLYESLLHVRDAVVELAQVPVHVDADAGRVAR